MSEMERNPEVPTSTRDEAAFIPAAMFEESLGDPLNAKGDLTFLRRNERVPQVTRNSRGMLSFPPQLHANHEILPCMLEEALIRFSLSKESPCSILQKMGNRPKLRTMKTGCWLCVALVKMGL